MTNAPFRFAARTSLAACLCFLCLHSNVLAQTLRVEENPLRWTISTENATYQVIRATDGGLAAGYFGPATSDALAYAGDWKEPVVRGTLLREVPYRGGFVEMTPALEVVFPDGTRELELEYTGYETGEMEGRPFLRFDLKDKYYPLSVSAYIRVLPELDLLEKWLVISNTGNEPITVERAYSGSVVLPQGDYDLMQFSGDWGREFMPRTSRLTSGLKSILIRTMKSQQHAPVFMVRPAGETGADEGQVWFGELGWSGNWQLDFEVNRMERTQISGGISPWDSQWMLRPGTPFETPRMIFGLSTDGTNGASRRMHRYVLDHVLPADHRSRPNPVLYNSWYATEFDVDEEGQVALAEKAARMGVELFVMDDGWFRGRVNDRAGLGDWTVDPKKFPNGLGSLIKRVRALGMAFGLWVEPEMINPNSDLFRAHPDWVLRTPHRTAREGRNQLVLNFARDDVRQFTIDWLDQLLRENDIAFIKWDMNRHVSEAGWPDAPPGMQRELRIRYVRNLYAIFDTLRARHPNVVFESCSSGGGRVDTGILRRADQFWTSDNTDATDRLLIQYGASFGYPAKTMVNWVTDGEWHNKKTPLRFRFHVAMAGNLGVGNDLNKWTDADMKLATEMVALYKQIRPIVQFGDQYRLTNPFADNRSAVQFVSRDGTQSVVFAYQVTENIYPATDTARPLKLHGLDPEATYVLGQDAGAREVSGRSLMTAGLSVPLSGTYASKVITIRKK